MGGLAMDIPKDLPQSEIFLPPATDGFRFVTPNALRTIINASPDELLDLSVTEIESKSKANFLAKALTCSQALWFIAQCLTRLAQHIPISLLELNTFGHAVYALLIYLLWWEKPFDVDYPTMLESRSLRKLRALTFMAENESFSRFHGVTLELDNVLELNSKPYQDGDIIQEQIKRLNQMLRSLGSYGVLEFDYNRTLPKFCKFLLESIDPVRLSRDHRKKYNDMCLELRRIEISATDVTRWRMALDIAEAIPLENKHTGGKSRRLAGKAFVQRCKDWPGIEAIFENNRTVAGFIAAALAYGGLHAIAWS
ncbi:MAG: hypothetical protein Q9223_002725, partial [Gallowayella weberi]